MRLGYGIARCLDGVASVLRALGFGNVTRRCRELIGRFFIEGITIEAGGFLLTGGIRDRAFLYEVKEGCFEPETVRVFQASIKPGMVVLDVGAYLGYYSLLASRLVGTQGIVYAFEPDPSSYHFLVRNINLNGCKNVVPICRAISSVKGIATFYQQPSRPTMNSLISRKSWERQTLVDCTSIDELLHQERVNVVKLDVEGGEIAALQGMSKTVDRSQDLILFVELNPIALREAGRDSEELLMNIKNLGFNDIIQLDPSKNGAEELELCNLYCRHTALTPK